MTFVAIGVVLGVLAWRSVDHGKRIRQLERAVADIRRQVCV